MDDPITLTPEMIWVLGIIAFTIFLFVSEIVRVDVAAVSIMILLGLTALFAPIAGEWIGLRQALVDPHDLFAGFSSNAVISIIAVMIIGGGLDRTGVVSKLANIIVRVSGRTERSVMLTVSGTVGGLSGFMQNVGAAALFIPVMKRIQRMTGLPLPRLLMPMGFAAIMGGTLTLVGSSPLILLNDLIASFNRGLPAEADPVATFELFDVTPIGIALVLTVLLYFATIGRLLLPVDTTTREPAGTHQFLKDTYGVTGEIKELFVPGDSSCVGLTVEDVEEAHPGLYIVGIREGDDMRMAPAAHVPIRGGCELAMMGSDRMLTRLVNQHGLKLRNELMAFSEPLDPTIAGVAEVVVRPGGKLIGYSPRDLEFRLRYGISILAIHRGETVIRENIRDEPFHEGDVLVVHASWNRLSMADRERDLIAITDYPRPETTRPDKAKYALTFLGVALGLVIFTDVQLSIALLTGAIGMILTGVLNMDEAYQAVSWKTVFLLASLFPLGLAVEQTGTAAWIAQEILTSSEGAPPWVLQTGIALLATFFTLVMSNVGATILLVPLAINVALGVGADPAIFALTVAIATSNSFLIPTHQVNALIMGPGGYSVRDFLRVGSIMTLLFLPVSLIVMNLVL